MKLDDAKAPAGGGEHQKLDDLFECVKLPDGKWVQVRVMPYDICAVKQHWLNIIGSKSKREVKIPKICVSFDPATEEPKDGVKCVYCDHEEKPSLPFYVLNVLVRSLQEDAPRKNRITSAEKKSGIKDPDSDSWTPIRALRVPSSVLAKIQALKDLNKPKGSKKGYSVTDPENGADINLMYNSKKSGTDKWQVQLSDKGPLSEEELALLHYDFDGEDIADKLGRETPKQAMAEFKRMEIVDSKEFDDKDDGSGDDLGSKGKSKRRESKSTRAVYDDSDDDKPAPKKSSRSSKKPASSDDSADDSADDSDDSEDDKPAAKKSSRSSKKPAESDDDDSGDDSADDDSDDDSDDKPAAKKSSRSSKKPVSSDDDDSGDDSDDDSDDDDKPAPKKSSSSSKKPASKSSRSSKKPAESDDDASDDSDDSDDDDGSDSDDDKPVPKKSSRSSGSSSKSSSSRSKKPKDDSDDDIPF